MKTDDETLPEYDFTSQQGERGKYYQAYRQGHTVQIHKENGTVDSHYFTLADRAIMLESDIPQTNLPQKTC